MGEFVTLKDVHEMLAVVCDPLMETVREVAKQVNIQKARLGIHDPTGIGWIDDMLIADHKSNGRL